MQLKVTVFPWKQTNGYNIVSIIIPEISHIYLILSPFPLGKRLGKGV